MAFKKDKNAIFARDALVILGAVKSLRAAMVILEDTPVYSALADLCDRYTYVSPRNSEATLAVDNKISQKIDDIKLAAARSVKKQTFAEILGLVSSIKLLIEER